LRQHFIERELAARPEYLGREPTKQEQLDTWIRKWKVEASNGGTWPVGLKADGSYGCSCPGWTFAKAP